MDVDVSVDDEGVVIVDVIQELVAGKDFAAVGQKAAEDAEFREGDRDVLLPFAKKVAVDLEGEFSKTDDAGGFLRLFAAAQDGFDPREEDFGGKGFGDVVVCAQFQAQDHVELFSFGGEDDDRDPTEIGIALDLSADVEAVLAGEHDVEDDQVGFLSFNGSVAVDPVDLDVHFVSRCLSLKLDQCGDVFFVFDKENAFFVAHRSLP